MSDEPQREPVPEPEPDAGSAAEPPLTQDMGETQPYVSLYHPDAPAPPSYRPAAPPAPPASPYAPSPYAQPYAPPPQAPSPYTAYLPQPYVPPAYPPAYPPQPTSPYTARLPVVAAGGVPAPYGVDPVSGMPWSDKSKVTAGLLSLLLPFIGVCGVGRLYVGNTAVGLLQLLGFWFGIVTMVFLVGFLITPAIWLWAVVDGIVLMSSGGRDALGRPLRP